MNYKKYFLLIAASGVLIVVAAVLFLWTRQNAQDARIEGLVNLMENTQITVPETDVAVVLSNGSASYVDGDARGTVTLGKLLGEYTTTNGDSDMFFELVVDPGGSGTFHYLALVHVSPPRTLQHTSSVFVGDRVRLQSATSATDEVADTYDLVVSYLDRKQGEPMSAEPTVRQETTFRVQNHVIGNKESKSAEDLNLLQESGLGSVKFGSTPEETTSVLTRLLGTPSKDTGWVSSFSEYGTCPGEEIRVVEWNRLKVFFGDTAFGKQAFFHYEYAGKNTNSPALELATAKGVTLGMSKAEVLSRYPDARIEPMELAEGVEYMHLVSRPDTAEYLGGTLEDGKVFWISGGIACGE